MVATAFEAITLDCVSYLDARVNPFIGYALEGFVVTSYLQWRTESERVYVMSQSSLQSYYGGIALAVYPITADFKKGGVCLHSFTHFNYHQEHSDHLIAFHSGDYVEIGLVSYYSLFGVLDFNLSATFGT